MQPNIYHTGYFLFFNWFFFLALLALLEKRKLKDQPHGKIEFLVVFGDQVVCVSLQLLTDCCRAHLQCLYVSEQLVWHELFQMADCWVALCSYTPLRVHHSLYWQHSLHVSPSAVSLSYFALFISISIFSFYLWTPLYLNYFREKVVLQSPRQSPIRSEGHFNISKVIYKLQNTIKLDCNGVFKLWWTCGSDCWQNGDSKKCWSFKKFFFLSNFSN